MKHMDQSIINECDRLGIKMTIPAQRVTVKIRGIEYELAEPLASFYPGFDTFSRATMLFYDKYKEGWPSTMPVRSIPEYSDQYQATKTLPFFGILEDADYSLYLLRADDESSDPMVFYLDHNDFSKELAEEYIPLSQFLTKLLTREEAKEFIKQDEYIKVNDILIAIAIGDRSPMEITELSVENSGIEDITGLEENSRLTRLSFCHNRIHDITPLQYLVMLTELNLEDNKIRDISALRNLTNLKCLKLGRNNIEDISALAGLGSLKELSIKHNNIKDSSPVYTLENLEKLEIDEGILDFDKINLMQNLKILNNRGKES